MEAGIALMALGALLFLMSRMSRLKARYVDSSVEPPVRLTQKEIDDKVFENSRSRRAGHRKEGQEWQEEFDRLKVSTCRNGHRKIYFEDCPDCGMKKWKISYSERCDCLWEERELNDYQIFSYAYEHINTYIQRTYRLREAVTSCKVHGYEERKGEQPSIEEAVLSTGIMSITRHGISYSRI